MASETSELTFVRCPSCRSLMPVSAPRCRHCGKAVDGGARNDSNDTTRPPGRVRQKTITASADELLQGTGIGDDFAQSEPPPAQPFGGASVEGVAEHEVVDPLADFLQEFEDPAVVSAPPPSQEVPATASAANDDDEFDTFLDDFETFPQGPEPVEEPTPPPMAAPPVQAPPDPEPAPQAPAVSASSNSEAHDPFDLDLGPDPLGGLTVEADDDFDLEMAPEPVQETALPVYEPEPIRAPEPEPIQEPRSAPEPARQRHEPRNNSEKRQNPPPQSSRPVPQQGQRQARPQHEERQQQGARSQRQGGDHGGGHDRRESRRDHPRHDRRSEEGRRDGHQSRQPHEDRRQDREQPRSEAPVAGPKTGKMRPGRLFGWLVSFESVDGRAIELREGKFFVTGSSIRGSDLVIEDPSISTPHALMSVSADHGLLLQDLMSERGIFVRSGDRGQYKREDGAVELKHGDWVRFGDVEFLLTVVPGGSR